MCSFVSSLYSATGELRQEAEDAPSSNQLSGSLHASPATTTMLSPLPTALSLQQFIQHFVNGEGKNMCSLYSNEPTYFLPSNGDIDLPVVTVLPMSSVDMSGMCSGTASTVENTSGESFVGTEDVQQPLISNLSFDCMINTGGPVWGVGFAPTDTDRDSHEAATWTKYLAVGLSRVGWEVQQAIADDRPVKHLTSLVSEYEKGPHLSGDCNPCDIGNDVTHILGEYCSYPNLLEVWELSSVQSHAAKLYYCIGLPGSGAVWSVHWFPKPICFPKAMHHCSESNVALSGVDGGADATKEMLGPLGILGLICGDGRCRLLVMPKLSSRHGAAVDKNARDKIVMLEDQVYRWELSVVLNNASSGVDATVPGSGSATNDCPIGVSCMAWCEDSVTVGNGTQLSVVGGLLDGSCGLWTIFIPSDGMYASS